MSKIEHIEPLNKNIIESMVSGKNSLSEFKNIKRTDDRANYFMLTAEDIGDLKAIHESIEAEKNEGIKNKIIKDKKNNNFKNMVESIRSKLIKEE